MACLLFSKRRLRLETDLSWRLLIKGTLGRADEFVTFVGCRVEDKEAAERIVSL